MKKVQTNKKRGRVFGLFATIAMAIGIGVAIAPKESVKTQAAETATISFANATLRESLSTTVQVWKDADKFITMTVNKNTGNNIVDYTNPIRIYKDHSVTFTWDIDKVASIESIVITANSNTYATATRDSTLTNGTTSGTSATAILTATNPELAMTLTCGAQVRWNSLVVNYTKKASGSVATAISVSPTTKSLFTTNALVRADYVVSMTKNGSNITATDDDVVAQIGSGLGGNFIGVDINWGETLPKATDTVIQFKSLHPETLGGSVYLTADVTISVSVPTLNSIAVSGTMSNKTYYTINSWDPTGLVVTASYSNGAQVQVQDDPGLVWSYSPAAPNNVSITSVTVEAAFGGKTNSLLVSGISVQEKPVTPVVISEAYGGGGNSGATLKQDFIELYNNTDAPINLSGWKIWYASATGAFNASTELSGFIAAKSYYLIQQAAGSGGTVNLPTADKGGEIAMGAGAFKVALTNSDTQPGNPIGVNAAVIDFLGTGTTANDYEGSKGPVPSATLSVARTLNANGIMIDTDDNGSDFEAVTPTPMNSALGVAEKIMAYEGGDVYTGAECSTKYNTIKPLVTALDDGQSTFFKTDTRELMANARARYEQWAIANNDVAGKYASGLGRIENNSPDNSLSATLIIGVIGLTTLAGYYFIQKKQKNFN